MSIVVIGVNHRTGPIALLERVSLAGEALCKAVTGLVSRANIREAAVLSTCNRTEVYAVAERFHGAYADIRDFFCELGGLQPDDLHPHLYSQHDDAAVAHLFEVAAGLDSDVLGESEILGQVRAAWETAQAEGGAKATLNLLFRHAVETGKRARTETGIARGTASVSHAAVEMATSHLGDLTGAEVLILGAGEMAEGMATALAGAAPVEILVANRTWNTALELADHVGGSAVRLADLADALSRVDVLLTSTGASSPVVTVEDLAPVMDARHGRPLLIVDIAVPRDVDPAVRSLPGVTLLDMDDLREFAQAGVDRRSLEMGAVRAIIDEEIERYRSALSARSAAPVVRALHAWAEEIRTGEVARFDSRLHGLDERQREAVEALVHGVVNKLLHRPTVTLKEHAGSVTGERLADALRQLYDLD